MKSMLATLAATSAFALLALGLSSGAAGAQPYYGYRCDPYGVYGPPCPRVRVYAPRQPYFDDYSYHYPAVRGFGDRNPVPRGNMRGCTVDLGYGRYESCDK
ncbi:MAG: hypothetical protein JO000_01735 [Alphaproteobacteria bacterium]|nr:hypothetical protein [Alphaproteobacteria bacterium]